MTNATSCITLLAPPLGRSWSWTCWWMASPTPPPSPSCTTPIIVHRLSAQLPTPPPPPPTPNLRLFSNHQLILLAPLKDTPTSNTTFLKIFAWIFEYRSVVWNQLKSESIVTFLHAARFCSCHGWGRAGSAWNSVKFHEKFKKTSWDSTRGCGIARCRRWLGSPTTIYQSDMSPLPAYTYTQVYIRPIYISRQIWTAVRTDIYHDMSVRYVARPKPML